MNLKEFNDLNIETVKEKLFMCCGSAKWVEKVISEKPFASIEQLLAISEQAWIECDEGDALEAFSHHPKIGNLEELEKKFSNTSHFAGNEQKSVQTATQEVLTKLAQMNEEYWQRFGFIFIIFATGKSADEMLNSLQARINNEKEAEIQIAKAEQGKITQLRLNKLFK